MTNERVPEERAPVAAGPSQLDLGQTELDAGDLIMPRVKVIQKMSDEANREDDPGKEGDFFNTLTGENYGDSLRFIPILPFKQRVFLVRDEKRAAINAQLEGAGLQPISEGNGLKCRSFDTYQGIGDPGIECNECPLSKWSADNVPPLCSETYNVAGITELGELIILSFAKSSARTGKRVFSMLRMRPGVPWASIYEAKTRKEKNDKGTFAVPEVTVTKDATPTELLAEAIKWSHRLRGAAVLDVTPVDEEAEGEAMFDEELAGHPGSRRSTRSTAPF